MENENGRQHDEGTTKRVVNRIQMSERIRLGDWMRREETRFYTERPSVSQVAEEATKYMGILVTVATIHGMRKALRMEWVPKQTPRQRSARLTSQTMTVRRRNQLNALERAVRRLYDEFQMDPGPLMDNLRRQLDEECGRLQPEPPEPKPAQPAPAPYGQRFADVVTDSRTIRAAPAK